MRSAISPALLAATLCACANAGPRDGNTQGPAAPSSHTGAPSPAPAPAPTPAHLGPVDQEAEILPIGLPMPIDGPMLPTDRASLVLEAEKLCQSGRFDEALSIFDTLLVLEPSSAELLESRASVFLRAGRKEEAADDRKRCCGLGRGSCCEK